MIKTKNQPIDINEDYEKMLENKKKINDLYSLENLEEEIKFNNAMNKKLAKMKINVVTYKPRKRRGK